MDVLPLELKSVTKKFGDTTAVSRLSLQLKPGEIFGLIGPNGSGKTTTMKMICGLYRATHGMIRIAGFDIIESPTKAKWHVGYVPDDPVAYNRLSGREFLAFVGELYDMDRSVRDERIEMLLGKYNLSSLADGYFGKYSRGTKQKISLIAAMLHEPVVLLIDEPVVGLDPESIKITEELLRDYAKNGGAILISTHTLSVAEAICTRFGILKKGKLIEVGTHAQLKKKAGLKRGTLEEVFLKLT